MEVPAVDPQVDRPVELRIKAPGWKLYGWVFQLWLIGVVVAAFYWGLEALVLVNGPDYEIGGIHHRVGIANQLWAIIVGGAGTVLALGVPALVVFGTIRTWREWRQLRHPGVVVDARGIRFEARRRPLAVSWSDVEQLVVRRSLFKTKRSTSTTTSLRARLSPDSAVLRADDCPVPADRWLLLGLMEKHVDVPYESVVEFLERTAGHRLEIIERSEWMGRES
jgi:hypothetical protein